MSHVFGRDDRISDTESGADFFRSEQPTPQSRCLQTLMPLDRFEAVGLEFPDEEDYQIEYAGRLVCLFAPAVPVCAMALRLALTPSCGATLPFGALWVLVFSSCTTIRETEQQEAQTGADF